MRRVQGLLLAMPEDLIICPDLPHHFVSIKQFTYFAEIATLPVQSCRKFENLKALLYCLGRGLRCEHGNGSKYSLFKTLNQQQQSGGQIWDEVFARWPINQLICWLLADPMVQPLHFCQSLKYTVLPKYYLNPSWKILFWVDFVFNELDKLRRAHPYKNWWIFEDSSNSQMGAGGGVGGVGQPDWVTDVFSRLS